MPRHRPGFAMAMLMALTVPVLPTTAEAQLPPSKYENLQRTLEDKFKPKAPLPAPAPAPTTGSSNKDDFIFIAPGKSQKEPSLETKRGSLWPLAVYAVIADRLGMAASAAEPAPRMRLAEGPSPVNAQPLHESIFKRLRRHHRRPASSLRQQEAQQIAIAKPNSYVLQLDPSADAADIETLLTKYDLAITNSIPRFGVITVEQTGVTAAQQPSAGAAPAEAAPEDAKTRLHNILEPQIIRDLRAEKIVTSAFVNTTMEAKTLPRPAGATIAVDDDVVSWRWNDGSAEDGNWGLKAMRIPAVWTVLNQYRKAHPDAKRPKIGIIDDGFAANTAVPFASMQGVMPRSYATPGCGTHHAMHVSGIIGARQGDKPGIDGIIPDARMDAIAINNKIVGDSGIVGVTKGWEVNTMLFDDVLAKTLSYINSNLVRPDGLKVINISLGYNFVSANLLGNSTPDEIEGLGLHILHQANMIRQVAENVKDDVLFVVAAGNDSDGRDVPINAKWSSPFAWAGTQQIGGEEIPPNIVVVEAVDRDGTRADFSNTGGQVAAPGVDIMSTLEADKLPYTVCSGTSQASPHIAALAAILFELAPDKTPAEIAEILKQAAVPPTDGEDHAGMVDGLDAVLKAAPDSAKLLADLDGDGVVGPGDLAVFKRQVGILEQAATANAAFAEDLNGDGAIDDNECFWPRIDLDGSGHAALAVPASGSENAEALRTDLAIIRQAWSDPTVKYADAVAAAGLTPTATLQLAALGTDGITRCRTTVIAQTQSANVTVADGSGASAGADNGITAAAPGAKPATPDNTRPDVRAVMSEVGQALVELRKKHPNLKVTINPATGLPSSVSGLSPLPGAGSGLGSSEGKRDQTEEETKRAVEAYFGTGGLGALYPKQNKSAQPEYVGRRRDPDFPDRYVAEVEQRLNGVPVFGSSAKLTVQGALGVTKFSGTTSTVSLENTTPKIAEGEAIAAARAKLTELMRSAPDASRAFPLGPNPEKVDVKPPQLLIFDPALVGKAKPGQTRLAWMVSIDSFRIFVDAETGEAFYSYRDQPSGMLRRIFDLASSSAFPNAALGLDEESRKLTTKLAPESITAFRNAGIVRDYYFLNFGRDGYNDNDGDGPAGGAVLEAYVQVGNVQNAYWCTTKSYDCPKADVMVYGTGYAGALDIVAHEMTHGVIAYEKNLLYLNEPGAVNESLADIFGTLIELDAKGDGGNWLIGESLPGFSITSPLRSLADPHLRDGNGKSLFDRTQRYTLGNRGQPDHYSEVLTPDDQICGSTAYDDNGCVHFNSGILNKFAFLVSEGGTHHGTTVTGIGRPKLARIAYRAMTVGLNQSSGLAATANAFVEGCNELASAQVAGIVPADCNQVAASQRAVGLEVPSS